MFALFMGRLQINTLFLTKEKKEKNLARILYVCDSLFPLLAQSLLLPHPCDPTVFKIIIWNLLLCLTEPCNSDRSQVKHEEHLCFDRLSIGFFFYFLFKNKQTIPKKPPKAFQKKVHNCLCWKRLKKKGEKKRIRELFARFSQRNNKEPNLDC